MFKLYLNLKLNSFSQYRISYIANLTTSYNFPKLTYSINKCFSSKARLDPYLVLEVNRQSDWKTIKLAYFRLARLYHPDLNKNDERAEKKFLQVKEAYEHFERKYVPEKYVNNRQSFTSKFEEESSSQESNANQDEFHSIRDKKKTARKANINNDINKNYNNFEFNSYNEDNNTIDPANYFRDEQLKIEVEKQKNISKFLFVKIAVPRSPKMVDRLGLKNITVGRGKMFGPEDYMSFTLITILFIVLFLDRKRQYKSYSFENLENVNIYNALKPSEVVKIYEDNEISPTEQRMLNSKEHVKYREDKIIEEMKNKVKLSASFGRINDVPKLDIKNKFKASLDNK